MAYTLPHAAWQFNPEIHSKLVKRWGQPSMFHYIAVGETSHPYVWFIHRTNQRFDPTIGLYPLEHHSFWLKGILHHTIDRDDAYILGYMPHDTSPWFDNVDWHAIPDPAVALSLLQDVLFPSGTIDLASYLLALRYHIHRSLEHPRHPRPIAIRLDTTRFGDKTQCTILPAAMTPAQHLRLPDTIHQYLKGCWITKHGECDTQTIMPHIPSIVPTSHRFFPRGGSAPYIMPWYQDTNNLWLPEIDISYPSAHARIHAEHSMRPWIDALIDNHRHMLPILA